MASNGAVLHPRSRHRATAGRSGRHAAGRRGPGGARPPSTPSTPRAGRGCRPTSVACSCTGWPTPSNAASRSSPRSRPSTPARSSPRPSGTCKTSSTRSATTPTWPSTSGAEKGTVPTNLRSVPAGTARRVLRTNGDCPLFRPTQCRSPLAVSGHEAWTVRQPWGPCGFIFPWNFPMLLIGWNISPALAAGNTVVIKPAEDTPLSAIYVARLAQEVGIPDGVINVVPGYGRPTGAALAVASRPEADVVHRFARGGPADRRGLRAEPRAGEAGTGRQGGGRGLRRRRSCRGPSRPSPRPSPSTPARSAATPRAGWSTVDLRPLRGGERRPAPAGEGRLPVRSGDARWARS